VLGASSNTIFKKEVASGQVGRLPLFYCFGVCTIILIAKYMGVSLVYTFEALELVTLPLCAVGLTTIHPIIDCEVVALMTITR
jgi:hypothetical protein